MTEQPIHEQVKLQLQHLKNLVDAEKQYGPSNRKWINLANYEQYRSEIAKNGDKNLLVNVKMDATSSTTMRGVYPFAKRYVQPFHNSYALIHRTDHGTEILINCDDANIIP